MNENEKAALAESIRKAPEMLIKENEDYRKQLAAKEKPLIVNY